MHYHNLHFPTLAANGYVYEMFGISKHFLVKLQVPLIRAEILDNSLTAKCFIYDVASSYFLFPLITTKLPFPNPFIGFSISALLKSVRV